MNRSIRKKNHNILEIQNAAKCFLMCASLIFGGAQFAFPQTPVPIYSVTAANGNGIRFWESDNWKMHMGIGPEYAYGPVSGYSIKINMDATAGRGWTWGQTGQTPIAALSNTGQMRIAGMFDAGGQAMALRLRSGNGFVGTELTQINFSYYGGTGYSHSIRTRHNANGVFGNALDFYVWQPGDAVESQGSLNVMTLNGDRVGIGTNAPAAKLDVRGGEVHIEADQPIRGGGRWLISGNSAQVTVGTANPGVHLRFDAGATHRMFINGASGKVGIGTQNPDQLLTVKGKVHAEEVIIDLSVPAPDYVFEKSYDLKPLAEVKKFIDENKHLPEVPSAKEMEKDGVKVGAMEMILLKKVEELTLYVIELKRENEKQSQEIADLKKNK